MHARCWVCLLVVPSMLALDVRARAQETADGLEAPIAADADADAESRIRALSIEVHTGTVAPLDVFVGAQVVLFEHLLLTTSVGVSVYRRTLDAVARGVGDDQTPQIVTPLLFGATLFRVGGGLRPFGRRGPELLAGYARIVGSATWEAGSFGVPARLGELSANVGIHAVYGELGWSISIGNAFLRPAIGFTRALGSRVDGRATGASEAQAAAASARVNEEVASAIDAFGMTPTLSLSLGGRFAFRR